MQIMTPLEIEPAMPAFNLRPAVAAPSPSLSEVISFDLDVHKVALNRFAEGVVYRLTGPDPQPVFVPQNDPTAENYRGLLLLPHGWPKTAITS